MQRTIKKRMEVLMKLMLASLLLSIFFVLTGAYADVIRSTVAMHAGLSAFRPGAAIPIALRIELPEGWYTYAADPGDAGMPPDIRFSAPEGIKIGEWRFPPHETFTDSVGTYYGFKREVVLLNEIHVPDDIPADSNLRVIFNVVWMICKDVCLPFRDRLTLTLPQASDGEALTEVESWSELLRSGGWGKEEDNAE